MILEDTVNTEAFVSPKNDMFTSSPNGDDHLNNLPNIERDANIIHVCDVTLQLVAAKFLTFDLEFALLFSELESAQTLCGRDIVTDETECDPKFVS